ncbi:hypothetical protein AAFF_G00276030 [Aldrovandia affinis]|uniref:ribonuclease H n=1 Tax=Aldrovandia affinis TaxID=143900 RepID=A0AAD7RAM1_9TELE|nr:hypothetical protein AAFF_G00276030 [Aldrovandia affinis]
MAAAGIIQPSDSPWVSHGMLVHKKDGSLRFCVNYRRLNYVTRKDSYPLPRIDDAHDSVAGSTWFSALDLCSSYWQVPLSPSARPETAFTIGRGLWEFNVIPFGLCNSPATFEELMEKVLQPVPALACVVYLDDILVHASIYTAVVNNLCTVFEQITKANLCLNSAKCSLFHWQTSFLGHVVSKRGVSTDPAKVEAVEKWASPTSTGEVRSFLGLAS